jgi:hypothetical protein
VANRETVDEGEFQGGAYRLELVDCGNERCLRCGDGPSHGPYWYRYYRQRGKVVSRYVGKELPAGVELARRRGPAAGDGDADVNAALVPAAAHLPAGRLTPNRWGSFPGAGYPVNFHEDGVIGTAIARMGPDALLDVDGEPLAELLGRAATDAVVGRASSQQVLDRIRLLRDRLPPGSAARRELDDVVGRLDAPDTPVPEVPAVTPEPLRRLMADLHAVPLVRRDPSREEGTLTGVLDDFDAG